MTPASAVSVHTEKIPLESHAVRSPINSFCRRGIRGGLVLKIKSKLDATINARTESLWSTVSVFQQFTR